MHDSVSFFSSSTCLTMSGSWCILLNGELLLKMRTQKHGFISYKLEFDSKFGELLLIKVFIGKKHDLSPKTLQRLKILYLWQFVTTPTLNKCDLTTMPVNIIPKSITYQSYISFKYSCNRRIYICEFLTEH